jgi:hypothetical protein
MFHTEGGHSKFTNFELSQFYNSNSKVSELITRISGKRSFTELQIVIKIFNAFNSQLSHQSKEIQNNGHRPIINFASGISFLLSEKLNKSLSNSYFDFRKIECLSFKLLFGL